MSSRVVAYTCGILLIVLLSINGICADIEDNEVLEVVDYTMIQGVKMYYGDRQCMLVGGLCVHASDCLEPSSSKGLCPSNAYRGVECCYELPVRPAPCADHLGACMDRCHRTLMRPGTDCQNGKVCCVLV